MGVVYLPFLQDLFKTNALPLDELLISLVLSTLVFWGVELEKWLLRR
jgi:Ca2+-transporting ATPase